MRGKEVSNGSGDKTKRKMEKIIASIGPAIPKDHFYRCAVCRCVFLISHSIRYTARCTMIIMMMIMMICAIYTVREQVHSVVCCGTHAASTIDVRCHRRQHQHCSHTHVHDPSVCERCTLLSHFEHMHIRVCVCITRSDSDTAVLHVHVFRFTCMRVAVVCVFVCTAPKKIIMVVVRLLCHTP